VVVAASVAVAVAVAVSVVSVLLVPLLSKWNRGDGQEGEYVQVKRISECRGSCV